MLLNLKGDSCFGDLILEMDLREIGHEGVNQI
jgi:hypothetical protein